MRRCKKSLCKMIIENCVKKGDFTLASGGKSHFFIDLSQLYLSGQGAYLIGKTMYNHLKDVEFDAIGGPAMGSVPLTAATVVHYWKRSRWVKEGFYIHLKKDALGVRSYQGIEGRLTKRHKVVVIEDVCTTGTAAILAVQAVRELIGCEVVRVVALVDREEGTREKFQELGIKFDPIFKAKTLLEYGSNGNHAIAGS